MNLESFPGVLISKRALTSHQIYFVVGFIKLRASERSIKYPRYSLFEMSQRTPNMWPSQTARARVRASEVLQLCTGAYLVHGGKRYGRWNMCPRWYTSEHVPQVVHVYSCNIPQFDKTNHKSTCGLTCNCSFTAQNTTK